MADLFHCTMRVVFEKRGRVKYISHLDLNRCMARALGRSGLPVWRTLGFHPHLYMTFALPLALGYESLCETVDFRLVTPVEPQEVVTRLNAVLPEGLHAVSAAPAAMKPEAIAWADYDIALVCGDGADSTAAALAVWCAQPEILLQKRTKKGERTLDVKPHFTITDIAAQDDGAVTCRMRCAAGPSLNINPTLLLDAFIAETQVQVAFTRVLRTAVLTDAGEAFA